MRYIEQSEKEVLDTKTRLIWQKAIAENLTYNDAQEYANRVAKETGADWRLPTIRELYSLIDRSRHNPASTFPDMPSIWFWSSTSLDMRPEFTYHIHYAYGFSANVQLNGSYAVRLVRGG